MDNYTGAFITKPKVAYPKGQYNSRLHVLHDTKTFTATVFAAAVPMIMGKIPAGAIVRDVILDSADVGAATTVDVGWLVNADEVADPNGFISALDNSGQAALGKMTDTAGMPGQDKKFTAETEVVITPSADTTAFTGDITCTVIYSVV